MRLPPVVIGTGHAGYAAIRKLVELGHRPVVLDGGDALDAGRRLMVERLARTPLSGWSAADRSALVGPGDPESPLPRRLAFGSAYPYADDDPRLPMELPGAGPVPSLARGGLSNVWGAAALAPAASDLDAWPFPASDLDPSFREILRELPLCGGDDELVEQFPLHGAVASDLPLPNRERALLNHLERRRHKGVLAGRARLAVAGPERLGDGCRSCGRCHVGCVYGAIWSASPAVERLHATGAIDYRPGVVVQRITEMEDRVVIHPAMGSRSEPVESEICFVAAGAINSTRIVLESLGMFDEPVRLPSAQGFFVPLLTARRGAVEPPTTLPSVFLELQLPGSSRWAHTQIGPLNHLALERLSHMLRRTQIEEPLTRLAARHGLVALCNVHSDAAGHHVLRLTRSPDGRSVLRIDGVSAPAFPAAARRVTRRLRSLLAPAGILALPTPRPVLEEPPLGWHLGGSMPMRTHPRKALDADVFGRVGGWRRTHVVDSAVFTDVPATTVALLAMANATRIVSAAMPGD